MNYSGLGDICLHGDILNIYSLNYIVKMYKLRFLGHIFKSADVPNKSVNEENIRGHKMCSFIL